MSHVYPNPVHWRDFFIARLARLLPVYEITLLVTFALAFVPVFHQTAPTVSTFIANLLMIQQWLPMPDWFPINAPSWSLSVEVFLYIVAFPILVWSRNQRWNHFLYFLLIIGGTMWAVVNYNLYGTHLWFQWKLALLSGLYGFGIGFSLQNLTGKGFRYSNGTAALGTTLILIGMTHQIMIPSDGSHGPMALGLILIVASSINQQGYPYRLLARPVLLYLGDISYSLYLWNLPILILLQECRVHVEHYYLTSAPAILGLRLVFVGAALLLIFIVSHLSYHKLEVPFRRLLRNRLERPKLVAVNSIGVVSLPKVRCGNKYLRLKRS